MQAVLRLVGAAEPDVRDVCVEQMVVALKALAAPDEDWPGLQEDESKDWLVQELARAGHRVVAGEVDVWWESATAKERALRTWPLGISPDDKELGDIATSPASAVIKTTWSIEVERRRVDALRAAFPIERVLYDSSTAEFVVRGPAEAWSRRTKNDGMQLILTENGYSKGARKNFLEQVATVDGVTKAYCQPAGKVIVEGIPKLNVWRHGPARPAPGVFPNIDALLLNLCGSITNAVWVKRWLATWLQAALVHGKPVKTGLAPVFYGFPGGGKNTLAEIIISIVGLEEVLLLNQGGLDSQFDPPVEGKLFVFANEVVSSTNRTRETANRLKEMVTEAWLSSQLKHKDPRNVRTYFNTMFSSNDPRALFIEPDDRRLVVLFSRARLDASVATAIYADLGDRGMYNGPLVEVGAFLYDLLSRKDVLAPGEILETPEKLQMINETGMSNMDDFIRELEDVGAYGILALYRDALLRKGRSDYATVIDSVFVWDDAKGKGVAPDNLYLAYQAWCKDRGTIANKRPTFDGVMTTHGYKKAKRTTAPQLWLWTVPLGDKPSWMGSIEQ